MSDLEEKVWSFRRKRIRPAIEADRWFGERPMLHADAVREREDRVARFAGQTIYGPVQRMTDPPYVFGTAADYDDVVTSVLADRIPVGIAVDDVRRELARRWLGFDESFAREIFDVLVATDVTLAPELHKRAGEHAGNAKVTAAHRDHVLDVMWERTQPDVRHRAEVIATLLRK